MFFFPICVQLYSSVCMHKDGGLNYIVLKCADRESFELLRRADRGFCELLLSSAE